jgi:hypothetical protein
MSRLPTGLRLWAAAALCILPLGLASSTSTADRYLSGRYLPGQHVLGAQAPARVFLVFAAAVLVFAAIRVRTAVTRRLVRAATAGLAIVAALDLSEHATTALLCAAGALALVAPLVWTPAVRPPEPVFVPGQFRR